MSIPRNTPATVASSVPALQWANGKPVARTLGSSDRFAPLVGFHIEVGKDELLDEAAADARLPRIEIKHQRPGGAAAAIVQHWSLGEQTLFYPVTGGPNADTMSGLVANLDPAATGLGVRWLRAEGERSHLAVRGFVAALVAAGYVEPVQLTTKSRMTERLLAALLDHHRVVCAADDLIDRAKHPAIVAYHEIALPLGAGPEEEFGRGDTATVVPIISQHPATVDRAYVTTPGVFRPNVVHQAAERAWEGIVTWAESFATEASSNGNGEGY